MRKKSVLFEGAEAELIEASYINKDVIIKLRKPKEYRNKILDEQIRKFRTKAEVTLINRAKQAGVLTPFILKIDKKNFAIYLEKINGKLVKEILNSNNYKEICSEVGKNIAKLHKASIIHGDLTTSNIIKNKDNLIFIDFGLGYFSEKIEDFATDLLNLKKTYLATHFKYYDGWKIIEGEYKREFSKGKEVIAKLQEIEKRARYY
ncbi:MAG: KEOPS complex kinase/ATPase Bud32 [Candidatus Diapherotrites archaeon]|nr:KEOPS complex kinase/ATPase Bud32 [Candidatus Diapherotrites archaeon]